MKMSRPDTDQTKAEKRKLVLMRQANSAASDKTNIVGARKERGRRPKPVTALSKKILSLSPGWSARAASSFSVSCMLRSFSWEGPGKNEERVSCGTHPNIR
jgi:hypothetical protein